MSLAAKIKSSLLVWLLLWSTALSGASGKVFLSPVAKRSRMAAPRAPRQASKPRPRRPSTLKPGPYAKKSIPARGTQPKFTPKERAAINKQGVCHTCGSKKPGTKSGNFVPDHQPPSKLKAPKQKQRLYPHCLSCSRAQGGEVRKKLQQQPKSAGKKPK